MIANKRDRDLSMLFGWIGIFSLATTFTILFIKNKPHLIKKESEKSGHRIIMEEILGVKIMKPKTDEEILSQQDLEKIKKLELLNKQEFEKIKALETSNQQDSGKIKELETLKQQDSEKTFGLPKDLEEEDEFN